MGPARWDFGSLVAPLAYWPRAWRLVWQAAPAPTVIWALLLIVQGLLPVALIYLVKSLVDRLVGSLGRPSDWAEFGPTLLLVALTAALMLAGELIQSVTEWVRTAQSELVQDHIKGLIHQQSAAVDLAFYESPSYYDQLERARNEAATRPLTLIENAGSLGQNGITFLAMAAILLPYSPWLPLVLLVSTLPALYVVLRVDRRYHRWWEATTTERRRAQYFDLLLTSSFTAAEIRLFDLGDHFRALYSALRRDLRDKRLRLMRDQTLARAVAGGLALGISGSTLLWMVWRATQGAVTLGDLTLFYQAFNRGQGLAQALLGNLGQVYSNSLFLGNLFAFLDLKRSVESPPNPLAAPRQLQHGIRFDDVTFSYPESERPALEHFDLFVPAGKIVAIVGPNGAGKTSLLKLLCRYYDPAQGRVELDGVDLRRFELEDLWRQIGVLFQLPPGYYCTARENIDLGEPHAEVSQQAVEAAARSAGAHDFISGLPRGYDTMLGKVFAGGVELSGGEWQRLATARAYLRSAPIIVLDEPTSFMDSWSEADWFERFRALVRGRTAIIITHRFTIAMRADSIHVLDQGRIVESGSHQQLLARDGSYASSWNAQMRAGQAASSHSTDHDEPGAKLPGGGTNGTPEWAGPGRASQYPGTPRNLKSR
jgi:ATP-binding cassette, subfamily B, bacterial